MPNSLSLRDVSRWKRGLDSDGVVAFGGWKFEPQRSRAHRHQRPPFHILNIMNLGKALRIYRASSWSPSKSCRLLVPISRLAIPRLCAYLKLLGSQDTKALLLSTLRMGISCEMERASKLKLGDAKSDGHQALELAGSGRSQEARSYTPPRTTYFIHCRRFLGISEAYGRDQESSEVVKDENEGDRGMKDSRQWPVSPSVRLLVGKIEVPGYLTVNRFWRLSGEWMKIRGEWNERVKDALMEAFGFEDKLGRVLSVYDLWISARLQLARDWT